MDYKDYYSNQINEGGKADYYDYYNNQLKGSGMPVFVGYPNQKGYGVGGFFRRLSNWIIPLFKSHGIPLLKKGGEAVTNELLKSATNIAADTFQGKNIKNSAKQNLSNSLESLSNSVKQNLSKLSSDNQAGNGYKRSKKFKLKSKEPKKFKYRRLIDVFDNE